MVIKPRGVGLGKTIKKSLFGIFYLSFAVTRLKIGLIEKKCEKNDIGFVQNGFPSPNLLKPTKFY